MSDDRVATLLNLLGELEGQLEGASDPLLTELREAVGATLAALYRANIERRLVLAAGQLTRH
ncbi:hypothetical protein [Phenylobacterium montanum]|uniref:Uncharacterized protein n=1 Tax=Phenylobacterium montanum TaxID=2823693 RepID=A0A975FZE4_9CAUL|nr:hypothetical protein [Caulobacter sp. S6]QUD87657.1 hypothetical protein KCG34_21845 [Caulobacter sp. S6]